MNQKNAPDKPTPERPRHRFRAVNLLLLLAILVLANLVGSNAFAKLDLTRTNAYSLSQISTDTLARIEDPLRVKVFYSSDVPAPYNGVRQYLLDLLLEYQGRKHQLFSYELVDTSADAGRQQAQQYGLSQVQIQEVNQDQFQSRAVYMGAVVLYGNTVERVDKITSTDGLEYRLTTAMQSAITQADALSGTTAPVEMKVFASPQLSELQIQGFDQLESTMSAIHDAINADNRGRIQFEFDQPATDADIQSVIDQYGVEPVRWRTRDGATHGALFDIVLAYNDRVERVPLQIASGLLGGYFLQDQATIEESVRQGLKTLVSANPRVAYATGNGEKALDDSQQGAAPFSQLLDTRYEVVSVDPATDPIPSDIETLIIDGPTQSFTDAALYRIDQFVMRGGSLLLFMDAFVQQAPSPQQAAAGRAGNWVPNDTGLSRLLDKWGIAVGNQIVLDEKSYTARQGNISQQIYQAPIISGAGINRKVVITSQLEDLIVLNAAPILTSTGEASPPSTSNPSGTAAVPTQMPLLTTSPRSWTVASPDQITPYIQGAPPNTDTAAWPVAMLLEGTFSSAFDAPVALALQQAAGGDAPGAASDQASSASNTGAASQLDVERFRTESTGPARVVIVTSSALTTAQMLDAQTTTPNSTFLLNAGDYLNGVPGFAALRSKGLGVLRLSQISQITRSVIRWVNVIFVPLLVAGIGLLVWLSRRSRIRRIRALFNQAQTTPEEDA